MEQSFPWANIITMTLSAVAIVLSVWGLYFSSTANNLSNQSNTISKSANSISSRANTISREALSNSSRANELSLEANAISNDALIQSKKAFEIETRPFINIDIKKQGSNNNYYDIRPDPDGGPDSIEYCFSIKITNVGKTPATNISIPQGARFGAAGNITQDDSAIDIPDLILGPGQTYQYDFQLAAQRVNSEISIDEFIQTLKDKSSDVHVTFIVNYTNFADNEKRYKTKIKYSVSPKTVSYLDGGDIT